MNNESIMGTMPVPRLIIKTSIPLIISLLVNNLYDLVDSIFVARVSEDALAGISLAADRKLRNGGRGRETERASPPSSSSRTNISAIQAIFISMKTLLNTPFYKMKNRFPQKGDR